MIVLSVYMEPTVVFQRHMNHFVDKKDNPPKVFLSALYGVFCGRVLALVVLGIDRDV